MFDSAVLQHRKTPGRDLNAEESKMEVFALILHLEIQAEKWQVASSVGVKGGEW